MSLRLDWATHEAARYACEHWHYSKTPPAGKLVKIGVWEDERFIGVVIFGMGANNHIGTEFSLPMTSVCELVRVALTKHTTPVSRIMSIATKFLRKHCPGTRLIISFADPEQNHHGGIYQASGWIYLGKTTPQSHVLIGQKIVHKRSASLRFGTIKGLQKTKAFWKHKYALPLDDETSTKILKLARPYPKRAGSKVIVALSDQEREGGVTPTPALQSSEVVVG